MFKRLLLASAVCLFLSPQYAKAADGLRIFVSKAEQTMTVYDGSTLIASSRVSTGKPGHETPSGIFSILQKRKYHESNIYSDAPMPFMQRLTWSGIALHEGRVPDYPASHGCVRLPKGFARQLFGMTRGGVHVVISEGSITPRSITHATLFTRAPLPAAPVPSPELLSDAGPLPQLATSTGPVEVAMNASSAEKASNPDTTLRMLITRRSKQDQIKDVQVMLTELGFDTGEADGVLGPKTKAALESYRDAHLVPKASEPLSEALLESLYHISGKTAPPTGKLALRQDHKEILTADIAIKQPERPLGTHLFLASTTNRADSAVEWQAVSLPNALTKRQADRLSITSPDEASSITAEEALSRIEIPKSVRETIEAMLGDGSSLTVTDDHYSAETGKGTDFITLVRD